MSHKTVDNVTVSNIYYHTSTSFLLYFYKKFLYLILYNMADEYDDWDDNWCKMCFKFIGFHWRAVFSMAWPLLSLLVFLLGFDSKFRCMYVVLIMAGYWVTECIPLYMTGLLPIFLVPILKIVPTKDICTTYMNSTNALFIVGLMIAIAIEHSGLHLRIALGAMLVLGCSPRRLHFGLSMVTMLLSMWLVNAATTAMMCPIIMAVLKELEVQGIMTVYEPPDPEAGPNAELRPSKITMAYFFAVAFSSTIGGIGTLVGTGTNLTYKGLFEDKYPSGDKIDFVPWFFFNVPGMVLMNLGSCFSLQVTCMGMFQKNSKEYDICEKGSEKKDVIRNVISNKFRDLGPCNLSERVVGTLFGICVFAWILRSPQMFPGWADPYGHGYITDSSFPYLVIGLMFLIPASCSCMSFCSSDRSLRPVRPSPGILTWDVFQKKFPWGMIFLLGGGFAIAYAGKVSGMSAYMGDAMVGLKILPPIMVLAICTLMGSMFTELTSNVAICNILIPVLMDMSYAMDVHPVLYTFPTGVCCSFSFLMPVGTPANAIALGYANIPTVEMIKHGMLTKLITWILIVALFPTYGRVFYDMSAAPNWMYLDSKVTGPPKR